MRYLGILALFLAVVAGLWWSYARRGPGSGAPGAESDASPGGSADVPLVAPDPPARAPAPLESAQTESAHRLESVRGTVTDEQGAPIHDDVQVVALDAAGEIVARANVKADGAFSLGSVGPPAVRIEARKDGYYPRESPEIADLAGEVRLVLERGGRIEGSLVLHPQRGSLGAIVRATRAGDGRLGYGQIHDDGTFTIEGLDAGSYAFELAGDGEGMLVGALFRIPGVVVQRGATTRDPRLEGLGIDALVASVELSVEDVTGAPVERAMVYVLEPEGGVLGRARMKRGVLSFAVPQDRQVDALVVHEDYRPARVTIDHPYVRVVLAPGIRVFLRPTLPQQLDRGRIGAFLRLRPELPEIETWPEGVCDVQLPLALGSESFTEAVFPFPGHYRLHVMVLERMGTAFGMTRNSRYVPLEEGFDVFERDAGEQREFWLPPDLFEQAARAAQAK